MLGVTESMNAMAGAVEIGYSAARLAHLRLWRVPIRAAGREPGPDRGRRRRMGGPEGTDRTQLRVGARRIEWQALPPRRLSVEPAGGPHGPDLRHRDRQLDAWPAAPAAQQPRNGSRRQRKDLPDRRSDP